MASTDTTFTIFLKSLADLTGITEIKESVAGLQSSLSDVGAAGAAGIAKIGDSVGQLQNRFEVLATTAKGALEAIGIGFSVSELNKFADAALKNNEAFLAWKVQILSSKEGSAQLVDELSKFNKELRDTTGTAEQTSRAIESQFALYNATGEQIKGLTKGVIEFAAARHKDAEQISLFMSRAIAGQDVLLTRFGIHLDKTKSQAEQIQQLMDQLNRSGGGNIAEFMHQASAGMDEATIAANEAKLSFGNLINIIRVPLLTQFTQQLLGVKDATDSASLAQSKMGQNIAVVAGIIGNTLGNIVNVVKAIGAALEAMLALVAQLVVAAVALAVNGVTQLVLKAVDVIAGLAKFANDTALNLSFGTVGIDPAKIDAAANAAKSSVSGMADSIKGKIRDVSDFVDADFKLALKGLNKAVDDMAKNGTILDPAFIEKLRNQYKILFGDIAKGAGIQPGTGTIQNLAADKNAANAAKAAADTLTNAKYQLASAQEQYRIELERTKVLEDSGAITGDQARARNRVAIEAVIAALEKLKAELPDVIAQQEKMGNVKGMDQARLEYQKTTLEILKMQDALRQTTFLGQLSAPIIKLTNDWANLGKQIGGFVTQQFTSFASTAGNAIGALVTGTGNLKQTIQQLAQSFISSLATMVIQFVLARTIMAALNRAFGAQDASTATQFAGEASAAWASAAVSASIATYGVASATGLAAYLAALAAGVAGAVGLSGVGGIVGGAQAGGYAGEGPEDRPAGVYHFGEFILRAPVVRAVGRTLLEAMNRGSLSLASPNYQSGLSAGPGSGGIQIAPGSNAGQGVHVAIFDDRSALAKWFEGRHGQKIIFNSITQQRIDLGLPPK